MFLKERETGHLLAVVNTNELFNPYRQVLLCRSQCGEEEQDPELLAKDELLFLSGEELPKCWIDPDYRAMGENADSIEGPATVPASPFELMELANF